MKTSQYKIKITDVYTRTESYYYYTSDKIQISTSKGELCIEISYR